MQHASIWFRGTYRYPSPSVLERALASARAWLDEEELYELDGRWLGLFELRGSTLRINTQLPFEADRYAAVAVVQASGGMMLAFLGALLAIAVTAKPGKKA